MTRNDVPQSRRDSLVRLAACLGLLGVFVWDLATPQSPGESLWYLPVAVLAHFQAGRRFIIVSTLAVIAAVWFAGLLSPPTAAALLHAAGVSLTVAMLYACYHYHRRIFERERLDRESFFIRQQRFESLAESLPIQIWTATPAGEVDYVGGKLEQLSGKSKAELQTDWPSILHPDDRAAAEARFRQAIASGEPYEAEFRICTAEGRYVWHLARAVPERDENGAILRWLGSALDVDHLHVLRDEAQELATRLRNKVESITDAFFTLDTDFRLTFVNVKAATVLGQSREGLLGKRIWECCRTGESDPFVPHCREAMRTQRAVHVQEWFAPQTLWLDIRIYPSVNGLTVYFLDITAQREAQQELLLLRTAVSRLNDIIMITEAEPLEEPGPRILFVNEAFERITGYTEAEVIGRNPRLLLGPETEPGEIARIEAALAKFQPVCTQLIKYTKAGTPLWMELDIVPIADDGGRYTHFVSVERDITERKQMTQQLQTAQRMEAVGRLTGGIAHDFNNLLTVVLGNADMLAEQLLHDPELEPFATMIVQAAGRGASLVRSLLAFARRQSLSPQPVAIDALVRELVPILEASLTRQHRLELQVQPGLCCAMVDPGQLESALLNLVINARDAMQRGGRLLIALENATLDEGFSQANPDVAPGEYVMVAVADTGSGIARAHLDRIFDPFFSTKDAGKGSGLGLSSVFGFIKQSGGHITVESVPGEGATFRLYLPRALQPADARPAPRREEVSQAQGREVLVVEDDEGIRSLALRYLQQAGYRTREAANGEAALLMLERGPMPDLLFTDVVMPGSLSGPVLVQILRERQPQLPVLFASGFTEEMSIVDDELDRHRLFLVKPYRRDQLLAAIKALLAQAAD